MCSQHDAWSWIFRQMHRYQCSQVILCSVLFSNSHSHCHSFTVSLTLSVFSLYLSLSFSSMTFTEWNSDEKSFIVLHCGRVPVCCWSYSSVLLCSNKLIPNSQFIPSPFILISCLRNANLPVLSEIQLIQENFTWCFSNKAGGTCIEQNVAVSTFCINLCSCVAERGHLQIHTVKLFYWKKTKSKNDFSWLNYCWWEIEAVLSGERIGVPGARYWSEQVTNPLWRAWNTGKWPFGSGCEWVRSSRGSTSWTKDTDFEHVVCFERKKKHNF